jgi:hypothetical protein
MRFISILIGFFLLKIIAFSQSVELMDKERISKNKIMRQTLFEYDYVKGKPEPKGTKARIDSFDRQGNRVEQINFRASGSVHYIVSFKYDVSGNKTEYAKYSGEDRKLNYKQSIKFNSKGNKLVETGYNGIDSFKIVYNYNKLNKLAEVIFYIQRKLDEKRIFNYSGSNTADLKVLDGNGNLKFTQKNNYNNSGKLLDEIRIEPDNTISRKVIYTYDDKDNLTSETKYLGTKMAGKITRIYNEKGLLSEVYQENADGNKFMTNKYVYNDKNWLIEEQSRTDANKDFSKNTYAYDENGICKTIDSYYASYKQQVLSVFLYDFY